MFFFKSNQLIFITYVFILHYFLYHMQLKINNPSFQRKYPKPSLSKPTQLFTAQLFNRINAKAKVCLTLKTGWIRINSFSRPGLSQSAFYG